MGSVVPLSDYRRFREPAAIPATPAGEARVIILPVIRIARAAAPLAADLPAGAAP